MVNFNQNHINHVTQNSTSNKSLKAPEVIDWKHKTKNYRTLLYKAKNRPCKKHDRNQ